MATTALRFSLPRTEIPGVYALLEADDAPPCEVVIKKANKGMHEIEIKTETANAHYFRIALGGVRYEAGEANGLCVADLLDSRTLCDPAKIIPTYAS